MWHGGAIRAFSKFHERENENGKEVWGIKFFWLDYTRSEEGRGGKEWRSGGWPYHIKKKKKQQNNRNGVRTVNTDNN